jgi:hypothetical protein
MPDPQKLVDRSIAVCRRLGMTQRAAAATVLALATDIYIELDDGEQDSTQWVMAIMGHAAIRLNEALKREGRQRAATACASESSEPGQSRP